MNLVKLKFLRNGEPSGREYTFLSKSAVSVGDTVIIREPDSPDHEPPKGVITQIDVPESEVEAFKDKLKEIVGKVEDILPDGVKLEPDYSGGKMIGVSLVRNESEDINHE